MLISTLMQLEANVLLPNEFIINKSHTLISVECCSPSVVTETLPVWLLALSLSSPAVFLAASCCLRGTNTCRYEQEVPLGFSGGFFLFFFLFLIFLFAFPPPVTCKRGGSLIHRTEAGEHERLHYVTGVSVDQAEGGGDGWGGWRGVMGGGSRLNCTLGSRHGQTTARAYFKNYS